MRHGLFPELEYTFKHALTQEVAYHAILLERRKVLHARAAQAIEGLCAARLAEHYNALAHHYSRSGNTTKAVYYLHRAGQQAVERSAYAEAVSHLTATVALLTTLPETHERAQQELGVQMTLGAALRPTKGGGAPEVERAYTRALALCEQVGEPRQLFRVLWGLWGIYNARGEEQATRAVGEQLLSVAQRLHDPGLLLEAHHALWTTLLAGGELAAARSHQEQGLRLYDPQRHHTHAGLYSAHDPGVCGHNLVALALWLLGYPAQALASSQAALVLAQQLAHPVSVTIALVLGRRAPSLSAGSPADPGPHGGRHDDRDRAGVSATLGASHAPAGVGAGRGWARGGGHRADPAGSGDLPSDGSGQGPTVSPGPPRRGVRSGRADDRGPGSTG